jgi:hypothetical protein
MGSPVVSKEGAHGGTMGSPVLGRMGVDVRGADGRIWTVRRTIGWGRWQQTHPEPTDYEATGTFRAETRVAARAESFQFGSVLVQLVKPVVYLAELLVKLLPTLLRLRAWRIVASTGGPPAEERVSRVRGWAASKRAVDEAARELDRSVLAAPEAAE